WKYQFGINVEIDLARAFDYYKQASDLDDGEGSFQVAEFYHLGIYVERNEFEAFKYFLKSAQTGFEKGIIKSALCYFYGYGVVINMSGFNAWLNKIDNETKHFINLNA
ncbi:45961_t:CDS:1, partial [Gigaspora margarita]